MHKVKQSKKAQQKSDEILHKGSENFGLDVYFVRKSRSKASLRFSAVFLEKTKELL